jgi:hypothetical protein
MSLRQSLEREKREREKQKKKQNELGVHLHLAKPDFNATRKIGGAGRVGKVLSSEFVGPAATNCKMRLKEKGMKFFQQSTIYSIHMGL